MKFTEKRRVQLIWWAVSMALFLAALVFAMR
jgi:hypothetical protein